jgi:paraquat-inducible protein B
MMRRYNPRVIGGFVLGALGLLVVAVLVFGSGELFKTYSHAVIYFQGSVGGLRVGAPVDFRGVQIGTVRQINIVYDVRTNQAAIPVLIDIDPKRVKAIGRTEGQVRFPIKRLVENGLRAQLRLQSFVTGQMDVQLDFLPRAESHRSGNEDSPYPEIPTVPSTFEQAQEILTELAAQAPDLIKRLDLVLDRASDVLGQLSETAPTMRQALVDIAKFAKALGDSDDEIRATLAMLSKLSANADQTVIGFGDTAKRLNHLLAENDPAIKAMIAQFGKAGAGLTQLSEQLTAIAQDNREGLKDFTSSGLYDLTTLIRDTQDLVANLNRTVDELRRNPSQFLLGQQPRDIPTNRAKVP